VKPENWKNLQVYEQEVTKSLQGSVTALCSYNLGNLDGKQLVEVAETHKATLVKKEEGWYIIASADAHFEKA
jgi:hypothetical protein